MLLVMIVMPASLVQSLSDTLSHAMLWQLQILSKASGKSMQAYGMPYHSSYHPPNSQASWHSAPPVFGTRDRPGPSTYNDRMGTPRRDSVTYDHHLRYAPSPRERQHEAPNSSHSRHPQYDPPQGPAISSQPRHRAGEDYYHSQQFRDSGRELTQGRQPTEWMPPQDADTGNLRGLGQPIGDGSHGLQRPKSSARNTRGGRVAARAGEGDEITTTTPSRLPRGHIASTSGSYTPSGPGTLHDLHDSTLEPTPMADTSNSSNPLSTNASKSSPPYTLSQRKQLRAEEKSYLKEVKRSIAEGRVPQVTLTQNNNGHIVQYKAQFLNALKLAALAIEPNADIDIHDPFTLQEIMKEVKRQFIIEQPLPDGLVEGFLQRLYKRNRAVWHRHWTLHGDNSKPDDCSLAAWSQLVDYWKSMEGNKECERNRTNASAKKKTPVSILTCTLLCSFTTYDETYASPPSSILQ